MDIMRSIIYKAVLENNLKIIKQLFKTHKISLKHLSDEKHNARLLYIAVEQNYQDMVYFLVKNGADVNSSKKVDICPLLFAISQGNVKMTELLLDVGANIEEGRMSQKVICPLHLAVSVLNLEVVLLLLAKGANVYARDVYNNETALHLVTHHKYAYRSKEDKKRKMKIQVKIVKALLEKGADIDARNCDDFTPVECALQTNKTELCEILFTEGAPVKKTHADGYYLEYLHFVVFYPCPQLSRLCLERGGDFCYRDEESGLTPYHCALEFNKPDIVKIFLEFNCPYDLPVHNTRITNIIKEYRPNDENIEVLNVQKRFIEGIKKNSLQSVKTALTQGAIPKGCSMDVPSTLHYVAANGNYDLVELLLMKGVPVNSVNTKGETPLCIAVKNKNYQASKIFLKFGACINIGNSKEYKVTDIFENCEKINTIFKMIHKCFKLVKQGNEKVLKLARNYYLSGDNMLPVLMNCVNRKGLSLMAVALQMGHIKIAEDLMKLRIDKL